MDCPRNSQFDFFASLFDPTKNGSVTDIQKTTNIGIVFQTRISDFIVLKSCFDAVQPT